MRNLREIQRRFSPRRGIVTYHWRFLVCLILCCVITASAVAAVSLKSYESRIELARAAIGQIIKEKNPGDKKILALKLLIPREEEVQFEGRVVRVKNVWLHDEIDALLKFDDDEKRLELLSWIAARLTALQDSVRQSQLVTSADRSEENARLKSILARSEYRLDNEKESYISKFLRELRNSIARFLAKLLFRSTNQPVGKPGLGSLIIFRLLLLLIVLGGALFGAARLVKHIHFRRRQKEAKEAREVLGEELDADVTSADLMARAAELAKDGDYRTAIRRAYIALLLDLELRSRLSLHPSKSNRDYLNALRSQYDIFPAFSTMTGTFEMTWYGQRGATEEEFRGFISNYDKAVGS
ncbi:MAG: DUF4129 domain-containing protein [Blastocatellia bacterium]|nr:DUF4129 domain-containing protein [Blastocatellia bacterium]